MKPKPETMLARQLRMVWSMPNRKATESYRWKAVARFVLSYYTKKDTTGRRAGRRFLMFRPRKDWGAEGKS